MRLSNYVAVALFALACLVAGFPDLPSALATTASSVPALRQSWYVWRNSSTQATAAPTYAPVPGDLLIVCGGASQGTGTTLTISDVISGTWNSIGTLSNSSVTVECWQRYAVAQDDYQTDTITITQSGAAARVYERIMEIGGVPTSSPFDTILMTPGPTATGTVTSPSLTATAAGDVMLFYVIEDGNAGTWSAPTFPNFDVNQSNGCGSNGTPNICTVSQVLQDYVQVNPAPTAFTTALPTPLPAATSTTASITMTTGTNHPLWLVAAIKQASPDYSMLGSNTGAGGYIPGGATAPPTSTPPPTPTPTPSATPPGQYHNFDYAGLHAASNTPYPGLYPTGSLWELGMVEGAQSLYISSSGGTYAHYYHDNGVLYYQYTDAGAFEFTENYPQLCTSPCSNGSIPAWGPTLGIPTAAPTASSANNNSNFFQSGNSGTTHGMCYNPGCYPNTTSFYVDPAQAFSHFLTVWDGSNAAQNTGPNALKTAINYYYIDVCCNNQGAYYLDAVTGNQQYPYSGTGTYLNSPTLVQSEYTTGLGLITNSTTTILTDGFLGDSCPCTTFANLPNISDTILSLSQIAGGRLESIYGGGSPYAGTYPTLVQWQAMENESIIMTQSGKLALNKPRDNQDPRSASGQQARMFQAASIYLTWDPTYTYFQRTDCACGSLPNNDTTHNPTTASIYPEQLFQPMGPMRSLGQNNISCNPNCTGSGIAALASSVPGVYFQEYHHGWHCELACEQAGGIAADKTDEGRCIVVVNVNTTSASFPPASDTSIDWVNVAGSQVAVLHNGGSGTPGGAEIDSGGWMDFTGGAPSATIPADTGEIVCNPNYH